MQRKRMIENRKNAGIAYGKCKNRILVIYLFVYEQILFNLRYIMQEAY